MPATRSRSEGQLEDKHSMDRTERLNRPAIFKEMRDLSLVETAQIPRSVTDFAESNPDLLMSNSWRYGK